MLPDLRAKAGPTTVLTSSLQTLVSEKARRESVISTLSLLGKGGSAPKTTLPKARLYQAVIIERGLRVGGAGIRLVQESLSLADNLLPLLLVHGLTVELRRFQHRLNLRAQCISLRRPRRDLIFQGRVGGIIWRCAQERISRYR